jgi:hypothetical protein
VQALGFEDIMIPSAGMRKKINSSSMDALNVGFVVENGELKWGIDALTELFVKNLCGATKALIVCLNEINFLLIKQTRLSILMEEKPSEFVIKPAPRTYTFKDEVQALLGKKEAVYKLINKGNNKVSKGDAEEIIRIFEKL